ncbi:transposable element Tcb1 transposase [Trichonephila clavipes]|uniref:Transposable element Tcb1 transposase n=1 Tax=Trichonephila clavipes TaxID=2585209 RepID=A0A8X6SGR4_TRICX|nr:transposable element Tcb1 transposase [Trichonephila clavipes]
MDVGVYGVKHLKANTLLLLPERFRLEAGALWSGECFPGILWVHSSFWKGPMNQYKYASILADLVQPYMRIDFPQDDGIYQQNSAKCHTAGSVRAWFEEHQDELTVLLWQSNSHDLNPIENLGDHLYWVVRAMDHHPRDRAQMVMSSIWASINPLGIENSNTGDVEFSDSDFEESENDTDNEGNVNAIVEEDIANEDKIATHQELLPIIKTSQ